MYKTQNTDRPMDANLAWRQIPVMTKMAIGARKMRIINEGGVNTGLQITVLRGNRNTVEIALHANDTYSVEFCKYRKAKGIEEGHYYYGISCETLLHRVVVERAENDYASELGETLYRLTHSDRRN